MDKSANEALISRRSFLKITGTSLAATGAAVLLASCANDSKESSSSQPAQTKEVVRMAILMDTSLCMECYACRVACQNQNSLPAEQAFISFKFKEKGVFPKVEYHLSRKSCMHCAQALCLENCPAKALYRNENGFVNISDACIGCGLCKSVCPYDVPAISEGKMHKCTGCESLILSGQKPACVDTCISNALQYGLAEELIAKANERLEKIKTKYPDANLYGATEQGGLGLLLILRTKPDEFGLSPA